MTESVSAISGWVIGIGGGSLFAWVAFLLKAYNDSLRAGAENKVAEESVTGQQWARFQAEMERLGRRIVDLENKVGRLEESEERCRSELAQERAERMRLEALILAQGQARQQAAGIVAIERQERRGK